MKSVGACPNAALATKVILAENSHSDKPLPMKFNKLVLEIP